MTGVSVSDKVTMTEDVPCTTSWPAKMARKEADKDAMKRSERLGELFAVLVISLFGTYFIWLEVNGTGFFTPTFNNLDMVLFYGTLFYGMVPALARASTGRRNIIRPFDVVGNLLFIISASYFLLNWPFDFGHFADGLPQSMQFIFSWITNDLAQLLLMLGVLLTIFLAGWTSTQYYFVRRELQARKLGKTGAGPAP